MSHQRKLPANTYRLQISPDFTLDDARELVGYVRELGVDWLYLSPLLVSEEGSSHGYDVVDVTQVDPARGGEEALRALAETVHETGGGILVDIVPNHVGVETPKDNAWWWDVLTYGQNSKYAMAFDIEWEAHDGKITIPVLGDGTATEPDAELEKLRVRDEQLHYYDNIYPLAPGTEDQARHELAERGLTENSNNGEIDDEVRADDEFQRELALAVHRKQNYELLPWREADDGLNYRRFFAVNSLAGVRVEIPRVFAETHREILTWVRDGLVDGLRVDHPDGLADPGAYFEALRQSTGGIYLVVEKILQPGETLPTSWAVDGTTGYDALGEIQRVFTDPAGSYTLDQVAGTLGRWDAVLQGVTRSEETAHIPVSHLVWDELTHTTRREMTDGMLRSEVERLVRLVSSTGFEDDVVADALAELLSSLPVYRSYLPAGRQHLHEAAARARARRADLVEPINALMPLLEDADHPVAVRFQQTSGMVMAKGVEDTAFYRYSRLASLNEVGGDPADFADSLEQFHLYQGKRQARTPASMTTLSTHDTKRSEDVRARIDVLSETPEFWTAKLAQLRELVPLGDGPYEKLLWETLVGAWPVDGSALETQRLADYAVKAAREAGTSTMWTDINEDFESRLRDLAEQATAANSPVRAVLQEVTEHISAAGVSNQLCTKLLQLTLPGVPDVYQGTEIVFPTLVDPDNRRPVDFAARQALLHQLDAGHEPRAPQRATTEENTPAVLDSEYFTELARYADEAKLLITSRALRARRDHPEWFTSYAPLDVMGEAADHVIAFTRGAALTVATRWPLGLDDEGGWGDTAVLLPRQPLVDLLTGRRFGGGFSDGTTPLAELLEFHPAALLVPEE